MKKLILFDLNGTIVDDNELWKASMEEIFHTYKKSPPTVREYFLDMEGDWKEVYNKKGIKGSADELNAIYIPHYKKGMHEVDLFPEVFQMLHDLKKDHTVGLITGQPEELVFPILERLKIADAFDPEFVSMHNRNKRPTIEKFVLKSGRNKQHCFYVGDSPSDIKHGNEAGIKTVAFLNGFMPEDLILAKKPNRSTSSFSYWPGLFSF